LRDIFRGQRLGFRDNFPFVAQADEDGGIVVIANPLKASCHRLGRRQLARSMRGDNRGSRFSHWPPRLERNSPADAARAQLVF
jgi:hypothetical protein